MESNEKADLDEKRAKLLPLYQCRKQVRASKIKRIAELAIFLEHGEVTMPSAWMRKHEPKVGGYYVVYEDGYSSFSPAEAFEGGYTRI